MFDIGLNAQVVFDVLVTASTTIRSIEKIQNSVLPTKIDLKAIKNAKLFLESASEVEGNLQSSKVSYDEDVAAYLWSAISLEKIKDTINLKPFEKNGSNLPIALIVSSLSVIEELIGEILVENDKLNNVNTMEDEIALLKSFFKSLQSVAKENVSQQIEGPQIVEFQVAL